MRAAIARSAKIKYICPKCGAKLTIKAAFHANIEMLDKLGHRLSGEQKCIMCENPLDLSSTDCRIEDVSDEEHYFIGWQCDKCKTRWHSLEKDLKPGTKFASQLTRIKFMMRCVKESCRNSEFQMVSQVYNLGKLSRS